MVDMPQNQTKPNQTKSFIFNMYDEELALNNPQKMIWH